MLRRLSVADKTFYVWINKKEPTELSVDFEIGGNIFTYNFVLDENKIISEELKVKNKSKEKVTSKKVFSRQWNDESKKYELDDKNFNLPKEFENLLRTNASVLSVAVRFNHKESLEIFNFWQKVETNVVEAGWVGDHLFPTPTNNYLKLWIFIVKESNEIIKQEAEKLLSRFDLGLDSFEIIKEKKENGLRINVKVAHSFGGQKNIFQCNMNHPVQNNFLFY